MKPSAAQLCLRPYEEGDLQAVVSLFYDTIHCVNLKDYTPEQADAWAPKEPDLSRWQSLLKGEDTWVAVQDGRILVDLFYETYAESVINGAINVNVYVVG